MFEIGKQSDVSDISKVKSEINDFRQIRPEEGITFKEAQDFWDNLFNSRLGGQDTVSQKETSLEGVKKYIFNNLESMKSIFEKTYKDIKKEKPLNAPNIPKWYEKGGKIEIDEKMSIWTYIDSVGRKVTYIDGYPVFPPEAKHPVIGDINIGKFTGDRNEDKSLYLEKLEEQYGLTDIPEGYVLHHDSVNGNMQLVKADWHKEFTHAGGHSLFKGEL